MTFASTREEIKGKVRTASFVKMEAVYSYKRPVTIIILQAAVLIYTGVVNIS
jgi:hypothetical protein